VKKILVNHPLYMIGASFPDIKKWAAMGAYIELNATVFVPESKFGVVPIEDAARVIEEVGAGQVVIDSDYGQKNNGCPVEGTKRFIELLVNQYAVAEADIVTMVKTNPEKLLGLA
jgi:predicted metal-dependent TIM-barrel fold hydrolase